MTVAMLMSNTIKAYEADPIQVNGRFSKGLMTEGTHNFEPAPFSKIHCIRDGFLL